MRPQFHHIDAQSRLDQAAKRRAERGPAEPSGSDQARTIFESIKNVDQSEPDPSEHFSSYLLKAKEEPWTKLRYHDDESDEAFRAHDESLKLAEPQDAEELTSSMTNDDYLDAISAQRTDPSGRRKTKPMTKKQMAQVDLSDDDSDASVEAEQTNEQTAEKPTGRRSIK